MENASGKGAERLSVARLRLEHVLGVEEHTIDLAGVTLLSGENASGKSSHLKALRCGLGIDRTSLVRLQRVGEDGQPSEHAEPRVEILLRSEDGDHEVQVTRRGTGSPEVRERVGEDWRKVSRPVEWLRDLIDVQAANPALWLAASDEDRAAMLLAAMPLADYSREDALKAAGLEDFSLPPIPRGLHPLEELEQIEHAIFGSRTETNRQRDREHDAAQQLLAGLPAEPPEGDDDGLAKLEEEERTLAADVASGKREAEDARAAAVKDADAALMLVERTTSSDFKAAAAKLRTEHERRASEIRAEAERRVAEDLASTNAAVEGLKEAGETLLSDAEDVRNTTVTAADSAHSEAMLRLEEQRSRLAEMRERIASLRATAQSIATDRHVRTKAEEGEARAREWAAKSDRLTEGLKALKRYKLELASQLPIKGLAVHFDEKGRKSLTLDGVPLSQVNDGRLAEIATEASLLRSSAPQDGRPYLPLVLLDGIERIDVGRRRKLLQAVARRGAQVIAACVTDGALQCLSVDLDAEDAILAGERS